MNQTLVVCHTDPIQSVPAGQHFIQQILQKMTKRERLFIDLFRLFSLLSLIVLHSSRHSSPSSSGSLLILPHMSRASKNLSRQRAQSNAVIQSAVVTCVLLLCPFSLRMSVCKRRNMTPRSLLLSLFTPHYSTPLHRHFSSEGIYPSILYPSHTFLLLFLHEWASARQPNHSTVFS